MGKIIDFIFGKPQMEIVKQEPEQIAEVEIIQSPEVSIYGRPTFTYTHSFNGEKNLGEIGPVKDYKLDFQSLRFRSWEARLTNEIAKTILNKYALWVIGSGLRLKSEPVEQVLKSEGLNIDTEKFNEITETRFKVWAKSAISGFDNQKSLNIKSNEAFSNSITGGDVLVIIRYIDGIVKIQLVDGEHVCNPGYNNDYFVKAKGAGNRIKHGIEIDPNGEHVAYYIRTIDYSYERVLAKNSSGLKVAYMVYGDEHRLDDCRGIGLLVTSLESLSKMDRYKEAVIGSAEEAAKVAYQIIHGRDSSGENPLNSVLRKASDIDAGNDKLPVDSRGNELANKVAATVNKQVFNMPNDSELKTLNSSTTTLYFKEFIETNINIVAAAVNIPPNVAMSLYNDSFSASRAATKDWEHTLSVVRENFSFQFYQPIYNFWLHVEILQNKISAPGYLKAFLNKNFMALDAYRNARFTGDMFPHIDPLKEVNAERAKLGPLAANIALTTIEAATEALNSGDSDSNMKQFSEEILYAKDLGIKAEPKETSSDTPGDKKKQKIEDED